MQDQLNKVKRLTELKEDPTLALYDTVCEEGEETRDTITGAVATIGDAVADLAEYTQGAVDTLLEAQETTQEDVRGLKDYLDNLVIEIEL